MPRGSLSKTADDFDPIEMHEFEAEHAGWIAPGQLEPISEFDFDEVDRSLSELEALPAQDAEQASVVLARLFTFVWSDGGNLRSALVRFTALFLGLKPDLVERTYSEAGQELGITKQGIAKATIRAEALLSMKFSRTRSLEARQAMRDARNANPVGRNLHGRRTDICTQ